MDEAISVSLRSLPAVIRRDIDSARLPINYQEMKTAIAECERIDQCKEWVDKSEQLKSYARQARDRAALDAVTRISLRARARMGELLLDYPGWKPGIRVGGQHGGTIPNPNSRKSIGRKAGLSDHEIHAAVSVAKVKREQRETLIEASPPVSLTQLVRIGERSTIVRRRNARGASYQAMMNDHHGNLGHFWRWASKQSPNLLVQQLEPDEAKIVQQAARAAMDWLDELDRHLSQKLTPAVEVIT